MTDTPAEPSPVGPAPAEPASAESSVFTKIIEGQIPGRFVWADDVCVAFATIEPHTPGHVLVVPRRQFESFTDADEATVAHLAVVARRIAATQVRVFDAAREPLPVLSALAMPTRMRAVLSGTLIRRPFAPRLSCVSSPPGRVICACVFIWSPLMGTLPGALLSNWSISAYSAACMSPIWCPRRMAPPVGWAARPPCSPSAPAISPAICSTPRLIVRTS